MVSLLQVTTVLWCIAACGSAYELQDTFLTLKEENLDLQQRVENLTLALRDLKHLLTQNPKGTRVYLNKS